MSSQYAKVHCLLLKFKLLDKNSCDKHIYKVEPIKPDSTLNRALLESLNVEQAKDDNRANLLALGGVEGLAKLMGLNMQTGLTEAQVLYMRETFGTNQFPEAPIDSFFSLLFNALTDTTLLVLIAAATVSLIIGIIQEPADGWIEGAAIFIAVFLVSNIAAFNDYSKQLQFRALEASSQKDERSSVLREGKILRINPQDIVIGDILVLQVSAVSFCHPHIYVKYSTTHLR